MRQWMQGLREREHTQTESFQHLSWKAAAELMCWCLYIDTHTHTHVRIHICKDAAVPYIRRKINPRSSLTAAPPCAYLASPYSLELNLGSSPNPRLSKQNQIDTLWNLPFNWIAIFSRLNTPFLWSKFLRPRACKHYAHNLEILKAECCKDIWVNPLFAFYCIFGLSHTGWWPSG